MCISTWNSSFHPTRLHVNGCACDSFGSRRENFSAEHWNFGREHRTRRWKYGPLRTSVLTTEVGRWTKFTEVFGASYRTSVSGTAVFNQRRGTSVGTIQASVKRCYWKCACWSSNHFDAPRRSFGHRYWKLRCSLPKSVHWSLQCYLPQRFLSVSANGHYSLQTKNTEKFRIYDNCVPE